ncbi:hypothetical protein [Loigolactobacillus jiayinensis]|uniref:Cell division protein FtsX n=1 Tax=Loigolactobacillus jiayinensis TaxID=2486016 RepID=A0ABW1R9G1_9LACO|nr:hypothetical protein [Loigolactobacillus jiayinensis]
MNLPSRSQTHQQNVISTSSKRHGALTVLLSILATICLLLAVGTGVVKQRVFNADYLVTELDKTDAGKQLAEVANAELANVITDRGLPSSVTQQVTATAARQDLDQTVRNLIAGTSQPISVNHIVAHAKTKLTSTFGQQSSVLAEYGAANTVVNGVTKTLQTRLTTELNVPQVTEAAAEVTTVKKIVTGVFWGATVVTVLCLMLLLWLDHNVFRFAKQFGWITLISGILIFIVYFGVSAAGVIEIAAIAAKSFSTAAAAIGNAVLNSYALPSYILMGVGLISLLLSLFGRKRRRN